MKNKKYIIRMGRINNSPYIENSGFTVYVKDLHKNYWDFHNSKIKTKTNNKWEFHSTYFLDIDFDLLNKELSKKNPLLLIEYSTSKYVLIHKTLLDKAIKTGIKTPNSDSKVGRVFEKDNLYFVKNNFAEWVTWAKKVKQSKWPTTNKQIVKVTKVTI